MAKGYSIPSNGIIVLGQKPDSHGGSFTSEQAFKGSLTGLNLWMHFLTASVIQGLASGVANVNGNIFQWRNFRHYVFGNVTIRNESEPKIPGILRYYFFVFKYFIFSGVSSQTVKSRLPSANILGMTLRLTEALVRFLQCRPPSIGF